MHGVPVQVDGVCMVKIDGSDEGIELAAEQFLVARPRRHRAHRHAGGGGPHARGGRRASRSRTSTASAAKLVAAVRGAGRARTSSGWASTIVSLTIRNVTDKQGYLEALGRPRTAQVEARRDPRRGRGRARGEGRPLRGRPGDRGVAARLRDRRRPRSRRRACGPPPRPTSPTTSSGRSRQQAGARRGARGRDRRAPEGDRADGGRGRAPQATSSRPRSIEPALAEAREIEALAEAAARGARRAGRRRGRRAAACAAWPRPRRWRPRRASWGEYNEAAITDRVLEILPAARGGRVRAAGQDREDRDDRAATATAAAGRAQDHTRRDADRRRAARGARGAHRHKLEPRRAGPSACRGRTRRSGRADG